MLGDAEQLLWRRLAVFSGSFTIAAAERVCADAELAPDDVLDVLTGLVENSIVSSARRAGDGTPPALGAPGAAARFHLLAPVRTYGLERLRESGEETRIRELHLAWCLDWTKELGGWWSSLTVSAVRRAFVERANILAALDFAAADAGRAVDGLWLLDAVARAC